MFDFISHSEMYSVVITWLDANAFWVTAGLVLSVALFIASPFIIAFIAVGLPQNYFVGDERPDTLRHRLNPIVYWGVRTIKNLIGVILVIAGIAMLLLPGQGLLTILIGVSLIQFPGKYRLERWMVSRPAVFNSINWIRRKAGVPELIKPDDFQEQDAK